MNLAESKVKAVVLFSGGLDSMLTVRILQEEGIDVTALNFRTPFGCCTTESRRVAEDLGIEVTYLDLDKSYLRTIENPRYPYGRGVNPCVDCRIHMFRLARDFMVQMGAKFMASGEVLGQRPNSQKSEDLKTIDVRADLVGLMLRPLSARLMQPTLPEKEGWVKRENLFAIHGRGRTQLIELGKKLGLKHFPTPSIGCLLTDKSYARRVRDKWKDGKNLERDDYELLKFGRHYRVSDGIKVIIGKNEVQNRQLQELAREGMIFFEARNFSGPSILVTKTPSPEARNDIYGLMAYFGRNLPEEILIKEQMIGQAEKEYSLIPQPLSDERAEAMAI